MSNADALRSVVDVLGSVPGIATLSVLATASIGSPFLDRFVLRRKRIQYQVVYNSKIGLDTVFLEHDEDEEPTPPRTHPLGRLVHELERLSLMIIRIRNVGSADIDASDIQPALSLAFGSRIIWNARVSEASTDVLRTHIRENLQFFTHVGWPTTSEVNALLDKTNTGYDYQNLSVVRRWLVRRLAKTLTQGSDVSPPTEAEPQWHGVRLANLWLRRQQSFILMVVLREAVDGATEISKDYRVTPSGGNGKTTIQQRGQGWFRWTVVTPAVGVVLVGALLGSVLAQAIIGAQPASATTGIQCVTGTADLAGSSAFGPIVQTIGDDYTQACPGSHIVVNTNGSLDGVRQLTTLGPGSAGTQAALSDGPSGEASNDMGRQQLVVLVYALLVNKDVGVDRLSTGQLLDIYSGRYTNWRQLGGAPMPIRLVARESGSGTRRTLEQFVLKAPEGLPSSGDCTSRDLIPAAPTILCELPTTQAVVNTVSTVPGAIGYADVDNQGTKTVVADQRVVPVVLDGRSPQVGSVPNGYPFWTVEYLYTWTPGTGSPIAAFQDYLKSDTVQTVLRRAGYTPCVENPLCTQR